MTPSVVRSRLDFISDLAIIYCGSIDGLRFKTVALLNSRLFPAQMPNSFTYGMLSVYYPASCRESRQLDCPIFDW